MKDKWEGYKIIQLESEMIEDNTWNKVGSRDEYSCPECIYLGCLCDRCKDRGVII